MGYEINWHVMKGDPILENPYYQKYSVKSFADIALLDMAIKADIRAAMASNEAAPVINYLCWLLRVVSLSA